MSDSEEDEAFHDASEDVAKLEEPMDLARAIKEAMRALDLFMNNRFEEARGLIRPWASSSMYHALANGIFHFLEAFLTFEPQLILAAAEALDQSVRICEGFRRKSTVYESLGNMMRKTNYDAWTEEEIHAELCYAECLLLRAVLTFIEDENLIGFVKGGLRIRSCLNAYKECFSIFKQRNWSEADKYKAHFESGIRIGVGTYNFVLSMLPPNIMKLLEFIGFSGNQEAGIRQLKIGCDLTGALRQILCAGVLLTFNLFTMFVMGHGNGDIELAEKILVTHLSHYSSGVWYNFFKARLACVKCNLDDAIKWYTKAWECQQEWVQFHHLCYWELMWVHCFKQEWKSSSNYADRLLKESRWSQCLSSYQKASFMMMCRDTLSQEQEEELVQLFKDIPTSKTRLAGKSLPMEKLAQKKSERFFRQGNTLILPAVELLYLWNGFKIIGKQPTLVRPFLDLLKQARDKLEKENVTDEYSADNRCLVVLLSGICHQCLGNIDEAQKLFQEAISFEKQIKHDFYLIPYATYELGLLLWAQNDLDRAMTTLEHAKNNYKGYTLEARLNFRIHSALTEIQKLCECEEAVEAT